jgi:hypothetical protein
MKNKKILIIALFLILFCLLGYSKSFASVSYTYNGNKITLPEIPEKEGYINYLIYYANDNPNIVQLKLFPTDLSYYPTVYKPNDCLCLNTYSNTLISSAPSYFYDVEKGADWTKTSDSGYIGGIESLNIVACTTDIYYTDGKQKTDDKPFFQQTPQVGIVAQQVEEIQLSQALQEVIAILPMTLVVLVSLVGLRKGLKMLETFLRQS